ncbi:MAG TPA: maleylpyruvate isomerase family mycothiol-dependent enzyme [Nocardioidaceae bacterium]|nr:maleylpyruvate isomerase family mycothiol-dependent enzyme [Nocardioidaceae bacterium]
MTTRDVRSGWLDFADYLRLIRADSARLAEMGRLGLDADVPSCDGWTVADVIDHTAHVYLHKVAWLRDGRRPDPWPPPELADREPAALFDEATTAVLEAFESRDPDEVVGTLWEPEQTIGFWYRRMALEVAVHRYDAELAHGAPTPIDDELATDGIDEALRVMLAGPWDESETEEPLDARIRVTAGGRSWTVTADLRLVTVAEGDTDPVAIEIAGRSEDVFLWLWGRRDGEVLAITGDQDVASGFRRRLADAMR